MGAKEIRVTKLQIAARVFAFPGSVGERDVARYYYSAFLVPAFLITAFLIPAFSVLFPATLVAARTVLFRFLSCLFVSGFFLFSFLPLLHLVGVLFGGSKEVGRVLTGEPSINVVEEQFGLVGLAFLESFKVERLQDEHRICVFES